MGVECGESGLSGWLGMPSSGVSLGTAEYAKYDVFGRYPFFIVQEWFAEQ